MTASVKPVKVQSLRDTSVQTKVSYRETTLAVCLLAADTWDMGGKRRITVGIMQRGKLLSGDIT